MSKRSFESWKQDWNPVDLNLQRSSRRSQYRIPNSTQKISKSRKRKRSETAVSVNRMEVIDETISSSKSRKRKKTKPSSRKPSSRKPSSIKRPSSRKPSSRRSSRSSRRKQDLPEFPEFSKINSPLESYDNKNDITMPEMKHKYHDNILPDLTNLLLNNEDDEDDEKYHRDNGDLFSYRLKKQLQHNKFSENDTRYINIVFYKKNLNYLYKYISFILNSSRTDNLYIFNIVCDSKTYKNLINDDYVISEYDDIDDKYISLKKIINDDINIPIKEDNFIIDLYSCENNLMHGIGFKRAFINKLFTDNKNRFKNHDLCVLNIDDNITNVVNIIDCMREDSDCNSPLRHIGATKYNFENENMCISIKDLFENMMEKIPNECYVMGIYAGEGEGDNKKNDEKKFNKITNSTYIYKLSLQKIFRLGDKNLFYYPFFSRCCEDLFFNAIASEYCYRLNLYKLRFGHFKKEGNHNDILIKTEKYFYNNGYQDAKTYYNHILKYVIDLKNLFKDKFVFNAKKLKISINNKTVLTLDSVINGERLELTQEHKYAKYQIVLFMLYLLFKDGYKNAEKNYNYYINKTYDSQQILDPIVRYCKLLFKKNNINDPKTIQGIANEMEKHLDIDKEANFYLHKKYNINEKSKRIKK